jgi:hypothetical protein
MAISGIFGLEVAAASRQEHASKHAERNLLSPSTALASHLSRSSTHHCLTLAPESFRYGRPPRYVRQGRTAWPPRHGRPSGSQGWSRFELGSTHRCIDQAQSPPPASCFLRPVSGFGHLAFPPLCLSCWYDLLLQDGFSFLPSSPLPFMNEVQPSPCFFSLSLSLFLFISDA